MRDARLLQENLKIVVGSTYLYYLCSRHQNIPKDTVHK